MSEQTILPHTQQELTEGQDKVRSNLSYVMAGEGTG
jgi:hypothetical protein